MKAGYALEIIGWYHTGTTDETPDPEHEEALYPGIIDEHQMAICMEVLYASLEQYIANLRAKQWNMDAETHTKTLPVFSQQVMTATHLLEGVRTFQEVSGSEGFVLADYIEELLGK